MFGTGFEFKDKKLNKNCSEIVSVSFYNDSSKKMIEIEKEPKITTENPRTEQGLRKRLHNKEKQLEEMKKVGDGNTKEAEKLQTDINTLIAKIKILEESKRQPQKNEVSTGHVYGYVSYTNYFKKAIQELTSLTSNKKFDDYYNDYCSSCEYNKNKNIQSYILQLVLKLKNIEIEGGNYSKNKITRNLYDNLLSHLSDDSDIKYNPRFYSFGKENEKKHWIDIFSAINNELKCFNNRKTKFKDFVVRYKKFVSLFEYDKPYLFYSRSIYEVCEFVAVFLCKTGEEYEKTIINIRENINSIEKSQAINFKIKDKRLFKEIDAYANYKLFHSNDKFITELIDDRFMEKFIDEIVLKEENKDIALDILVDFFSIMYLKEKMGNIEHCFFAKEYSDFYFSTISKVLSYKYKGSKIKDKNDDNDFFNIKDNLIFEFFSKPNDYKEKEKKLPELFAECFNLLSKKDKEIYLIIMYWHSKNYVKLEGLDDKLNNLDKEYKNVYTDFYKSNETKGRIIEIINIMRFCFVLKLLEKEDSKVLNYKSINRILSNNNLRPLKEYKENDTAIMGLEIDYLIYKKYENCVYSDNYIYSDDSNYGDEHGM